MTLFPLSEHCSIPGSERHTIISVVLLQVCQVRFDTLNSPFTCGTAAASELHNPVAGDIFVHATPRRRQIWLRTETNTWLALPDDAGGSSGKPVLRPGHADSWLWFPLNGQPDMFNSQYSPSWVQWETLKKNVRTTAKMIGN